MSDAKRNARKPCPRLSGRGALGVLSFLALGALRPASADDAPEPNPEFNKEIHVEHPDPKKGFEILMTVPMAGSLMKIGDLDRIWNVWEPDEKAKAGAATPEERHKMTFERYGFIERDFDKSGLPLGYIDDGKGNLVTNCFSCHGGKVAGKSMPGVGNSHSDLTTISVDTARLRLFDQGRDFSKIEAAPMPFGLVANYSKGYTNATQFAPFLGAMRDENLDLIGLHNPGPMVNNDMIAPAWWRFKKKDRIYIDAFAPKTHRTLMQFTMSPSNSGADIRSWEENFFHIQAYIESLEPPKYPYEINQALANEGRQAFEQTCSRCHGTYGPNGKFPNKIIPLEKIGTDPVRFGAVSRQGREMYNKMWFSDYGKHPVDLESKGYIAQPLDGIWATGPYFHNGAVPTLNDVLNPSTRPKIWKRDENGYDTKKVGLLVEAFDAVPEGLNARRRRMYYDTATPSHSAAGHLFPDELTPEEKVSVLEYLKTL